NLRMIAESVDDVGATVDEIDDAFGQAGLLEEFVDAVHGERNALGGLEDEGVSTGDGVGQKPERNHRREVEGDDGGDHAERLADERFVDARRDVFKVVALHHHGDAAGDFNVFDAAAQLSFGFGKGLAIFHGDKPRQLVEVLFEKILQLEEVLHALAGRGAAPHGKCIRRRFDGGFNVSSGRHWRACQKLGGGRIRNVEVVSSGGTPPSSGDIVLKIGRVCG